MLEVASAALTIERARRIDSVTARLQDLHELGLNIISPACRNARKHSLTGQGEGDEDSLTVRKSESVASRDEFLDT
jgi:hypothetical protein